MLDEHRATKVCGDELDALQRMTRFVVRATIRIAKLREAKATVPASPAAESTRSLAPREG